MTWIKTKEIGAKKRWQRIELQTKVKTNEGWTLCVDTETPWKPNKFWEKSKENPFRNHQVIGKWSSRIGQHGRDETGAECRLSGTECRRMAKRAHSETTYGSDQLLLMRFRSITSTAATSKRVERTQRCRRCLCWPVLTSAETTGDQGWLVWLVGLTLKMINKDEKTKKRIKTILHIST